MLLGGFAGLVAVGYSSQAIADRLFISVPTVRKHRENGFPASIAALSMVMGFGIIWHMWLLTGVSFVAMMAAIIVHTFNYKRDFYISAEEVTRTENARTKLLEAHV